MGDKLSGLWWYIFAQETHNVENTLAIFDWDVS